MVPGAAQSTGNSFQSGANGLASAGVSANYTGQLYLAATTTDHRVDPSQLQLARGMIDNMLAQGNAQLKDVNLKEQLAQLSVLLDRAVLKFQPPGPGDTILGDLKPMGWLSRQIHYATDRRFIEFSDLPKWTSAVLYDRITNFSPVIDAARQISPSIAKNRFFNFAFNYRPVAWAVWGAGIAFATLDFISRGGLVLNANWENPKWGAKIPGIASQIDTIQQYAQDQREQLENYYEKSDRLKGSILKSNPVAAEIFRNLITRSINNIKPAIDNADSKKFSERSNLAVSRERVDNLVNAVWVGKALVKEVDNWVDKLISIKTTPEPPSTDPDLGVGPDDVDPDNGRPAGPAKKAKVDDKQKDEAIELKVPSVADYISLFETVEAKLDDSNKAYEKTRKRLESALGLEGYDDFKAGAEKVILQHSRTLTSTGQTFPQLSEIDGIAAFLEAIDKGEKASVTVDKQKFTIAPGFLDDVKQSLTALEDDLKMISALLQNDYSKSNEDHELQQLVNDIAGQDRLLMREWRSIKDLVDKNQKTYLDSHEKQAVLDRIGNLTSFLRAAKAGQENEITVGGKTIKDLNLEPLVWYARDILKTVGWQKYSPNPRNSKDPAVLFDKKVSGAGPLLRKSLEQGRCLVKILDTDPKDREDRSILISAAAFEESSKQIITRHYVVTPNVLNPLLEGDRYDQTAWRDNPSLWSKIKTAAARKHFETLALENNAAEVENAASQASHVIRFNLRDELGKKARSFADQQLDLHSGPRVLDENELYGRLQPPSPRDKQLTRIAGFSDFWNSLSEPVAVELNVKLNSATTLSRRMLSDIDRTLSAARVIGDWNQGKNGDQVARLLVAALHTKNEDGSVRGDVSLEKKYPALVALNRRSQRSDLLNRTPEVGLLLVADTVGKLRLENQAHVLSSGASQEFDKTLDLLVRRAAGELTLTSTSGGKQFYEALTPRQQDAFLTSTSSLSPTGLEAIARISDLTYLRRKDIASDLLTMYEEILSNTSSPLYQAFQSVSDVADGRVVAFEQRLSQVIGSGEVPGNLRNVMLSSV